MYDHTQTASSLNFATVTKTNKKSHVYNHKQKDSKKRLYDVTAQRIKTILYNRKKNSYFTGTLKNSFLIFRNR